MHWPKSEQFCCNDLKSATTELPASLIAKQETGVAYLAVGYVETEDGMAWFDQALFFCPFCGTKLQTADEIKRKVNN